MSNVLEGLEPKLVWKYFEELSGVPRPSKHEEEVREYLISTAAKFGYEAKTDEAGNVVIKIPATPGYENAPVVVLQGHMDMVPEKSPDTEHDFLKDPIPLKIDGDWVTSAKATTLGADNGIGVAAGLAFLEDKDAVHGPLEILVTVDEETGLNGAFSLEPGFVEGRLLLNLDSEEDGAIYVGCAGGGEVTAYYDIKTAPVRPTDRTYKITVEGLRGGHSGLNIIENRANALRILARLLKFMEKEGYQYVLMDLAGGSAHNAIPREAHATVVVSNADDALAEKLGDRFRITRKEYGKRERNMTLVVEQVSTPPVAWSKDMTRNLVDLMLTVPNGVLSMSQDLPNLVESSANLAVVKTDGDRLEVEVSMRSSVDPVIEEIQESTAIIAERCGAEPKVWGNYPGWQPDMDSPLLKGAIEVFREKFGTEPKVKAIHAGLETGVIAERYPGMKSISFGPEIHGAHSPTEKVQISSVQKFWEFLKTLLEDIARNPGRYGA